MIIECEIVIIIISFTASCAEEPRAGQLDIMPSTTWLLIALPLLGFPSPKIPSAQPHLCTKSTGVCCCDGGDYLSLQLVCWTHVEQSVTTVCPSGFHCVQVPWLLPNHPSCNQSVHWHLQLALIIDTFHKSILSQSSCIFSLLPPPRDLNVTSRLRTASTYPRPMMRTKRYYSFVQHGLLHYQTE